MVAAVVGVVVMVVVCECVCVCGGNFIHKQRNL